VFFRLSTRHLFLFLLLFAASGCQKKSAGPPPRYAIVRFENLSGDATLDWVGRAASEVLSNSLAGVMNGPVLSSAAVSRSSSSLGTRPAPAPGISTARDAARVAGATRLISGYIERAGAKVRVTASEEDLSSGKTLSIRSVVDNSVLGALSRLAHEFSPSARAYETTNVTALQRYATALEAPPEERETALEKATEADPDFGAVWLARAGAEAVRGNREAAEALIGQARQQKLSEFSLASLDLEAAALKGDTGARIQAMRRISTLRPGDGDVLRSLAETETAAGNFRAAAEDWQKLTQTLPADPGAWNSLGYALSYAGDYAGARAAFEEYRKLRPNDANPLDSIGDLDYAWRKFGDAAANYSQASAKQPDFEQYGDLYKAAWAKFNAGDKAGAETLFAQFREARTRASDPLITLRWADWLYRTGRAKQAVTYLRQTVSETKSESVRVTGYSQLAIWDLLEGDRASAARDAAGVGKVSTPAQALARFVALPSASVAEWESRAERMMPQPAMGDLRRLAIGYALLLDGKREAAVPVWQEIVRRNPATDFFSRAVYARLQGKPVERALLPDPTNVNQFQALLDRL
jgi:tetratricopeptide (TPR) repeat protein/TolB-like protein